MRRLIQKEMKAIHHTGTFNEKEVLHHLKHFLPSQSPLKDFIHHNTLHAFQDKDFHSGLLTSSAIFGYKPYLQIDEYRALHMQGKISSEALRISWNKWANRNTIGLLYEDLTEKKFRPENTPRIGEFRDKWKNFLRYDFSKKAQPILFRIISSYVDQGISITRFPVSDKGFLHSIRLVEEQSVVRMFKSERVHNLLFDEKTNIDSLLDLLVGDKSLFDEYLFDQQFEHPGWSGMVSVLESNPETLFDSRVVSLREFIILELFLEIETLDAHFGQTWKPAAYSVMDYHEGQLFSFVPENKLHLALLVWHEAMEWTFYDNVLTGIEQTSSKEPPIAVIPNTFQAVFCIDDRECSLRRYLEKIDPNCATFGTAGFFNIEFYFQPEGGKFYTKSCPAPVSPKYLIREEQKTLKRKKDLHFSKRGHGLLGGWLISQTLGMLDAFRLLFIIFRPTLSSAASFSFHHMDKKASLSVENVPDSPLVDGLQVGFTVREMADRVEGLLKGIGLVRNFSPIVYIVGHGASSVNNTYYAGYDCGACSGRPGSVNARVAAHMANDPRVRLLLTAKGIEIPQSTQFVGALQDTTRDEIEYFDEQVLNNENRIFHEQNKPTFLNALEENAKERARRFVMMDHQGTLKNVHKKIKLRSVSLFEPRPEYNHATNSLCIIGRRNITKNLFLDRRSFLNSYDYSIDPEGNYLLPILRAIAPVCGGINLEYFFSRVDNQRLGSGSKLPHNVIGLIGVANGADGDLRAGLPLQMIEIHDPVRLLVVVEHFPETIVETLEKSPSTYEWFLNSWIHLISINPDTGKFMRLVHGKFEPYTPIHRKLQEVNDVSEIIKINRSNIDPVILK